MKTLYDEMQMVKGWFARSLPIWAGCLLALVYTVAYFFIPTTNEKFGSIVSLLFGEKWWKDGMFLSSIYIYSLGCILFFPLFFIALFFKKKRTKSFFIAIVQYILCFMIFGIFLAYVRLFLVVLNFKNSFPL